VKYEYDLKRYVEDVGDCTERWRKPFLMEGPQRKRSNLHYSRCAKIFRIIEEEKRVVVRNLYPISQ
jgi:hypothetical protein